MTATAPELRTLLSPQEAADRFGVSKDTIRRWARQGRIESIRLGHRTVRYRVEDLDKLVERSS